MATKLDIVNAALALLGQEPVLDLGSASLGQSNSALKLTRQIDQTRDVTLRRHGWLCALDYVTLSPAVIPGYANWKYPTAYLLPAAALRIWEIDGRLWRDGVGWGWWGCRGWEGVGQRWETGTIDTDIGARLIIRSIITDSLNVAYVRTPSWQAIDAHVGDAIAAMLAWRACRSVTGQDPGQDMKAETEERVQLAISVDGTQAAPMLRGPSELHLIRQHGAG